MVWRSERLRGAAALAALVLAATVPFLDKAIHVDDYFYLRIARHILEDPLRPYDFTMIAGGEPHRVHDYSPSPPLVPYVLAVGIRVFGERELPLHCVMAVFTAALAVATFVLAWRFGAPPVAATALVVLNPIFVPGQNLMLDAPMLALGLSGLACHVTGTDRRSVWLVAAGGLLAGLAVVTKYPALILVPLCAGYSFTRRCRLGWVAVALALLPLGVWSVQNFVCHGDVHVVEQLLRGPSARATGLVPRAVATLTIFGSGLLPWLTVPRIALNRWLHAACLASSVAIAVAWQWLAAPATGPRQAAEHVLFLACGLFVTLICVTASWRGNATGDAHARSDAYFLVCWLLLAEFMALRAPFMAVRHVLWALPCGAILLLRSLPRDRGRIHVWWLRGAVAVVAAFGLGLGWVDKEIAAAHRRFALVRVQEFVIEKPHRPVFFASEHGFAYYCETFGLQPLPTDVTNLRLGTTIFAAVLEYPVIADRLKRELEGPWQFIEPAKWRPVTPMSHGVNFYATGTTDLPWEFAVPLVYFEAYRTRFLGAPPPADGP